MNGFGVGPVGVPESQHSIFIRGFPGDMDMNRIRDFFEKEAGHCTFDFFKQSADKSRLFVAVRFDTRDIARDTMVRFNNKEIFGHRVYMTWFKDIRRYVAYTGQILATPYTGTTVPSRGRGSSSRVLTRGSSRGSFLHPDSSARGGMFVSRGRGSYRGGGAPSSSYQTSFYNPTVQKIRAKARAPSVVPTRTVYREKSKSRSSSRSRSNDDKEDDKRSESSSRSRSNTPKSKTRSKSPADRKRSRSRASRERRSSPPSSYKMPRKPSKERSSKRRRRSSASSRSSGEVSVSPSRNKKARKRPRKSKSPDSDAESTTSRSSTKSSKARSSPERAKSRSPPSNRHEAAVTDRSKPEKKLQSAVQAVMPSSSAVTTKQQDDKEEIVKSRDLSMSEEIFTIQKSTLANVLSGEKSPTAGDKKNKHQKQKKNRYKDKEKEPLRLSSVTKDVSAENDRQKKISNLAPEKLQELHEKRKELEQSYKQDCDTFATVVKMLISKDPSMEDKLLSSLRDSLKDIGQKFITELNEFVDTLLLTE